MRIYFLAPILLLTSAPSIAAPVYLQCPIADEKGKGTVTADLTLNEDAGTVSLHFRETGYSAGAKSATFTSDAVRWENIVDILHGRYTVDRSTLRYAETVSMGEKTIMTRNGTCTVATAEERKF